jgi:hypothetical protein
MLMSLIGGAQLLFERASAAAGIHAPGRGYRSASLFRIGLWSLPPGGMVGSVERGPKTSEI